MQYISYEFTHVLISSAAFRLNGIRDCGELNSRKPDCDPCDIHSGHFHGEPFCGTLSGVNDGPGDGYEVDGFVTIIVNGGCACEL